MTADGVADWRKAASPDLTRAIEAAIEQFQADEEYEKIHGKLSDTLKILRAVSEHSRGLVNAIETLSPVGMASIHEEGAARGIQTGRYELGDVVRRLEGVSDIALAAADRLLSMHSPLPDEEQGQGSGSAVGRDSDLRAVRAEHDRERFLFAFRSPKDKFGVRAVKAYLTHTPGFDVATHGSGRTLTSFLAGVWTEVRPGEPTSWKRLVHARHALGDLVARSIAAQKIWRPIVEKGNASSRRSRRPPPGES